MVTGLGGLGSGRKQQAPLSIQAQVGKTQRHTVQGAQLDGMHSAQHLGIQTSTRQLLHQRGQIKADQRVDTAGAVAALGQPQVLTLHHCTFQIEVLQLAFEGQVQRRQVQHPRHAGLPQHTPPTRGGGARTQGQQGAVR